MRYKYQLYVDGHCAAMRYASMMCLGAVIMKVRGEETEAGEMFVVMKARGEVPALSSPPPSGGQRDQGRLDVVLPAAAAL